MHRAYLPIIGIVPEGWAVLGLLSLLAWLGWEAAAPLPSLVAAVLVPVAAVFFADGDRTVNSRPRGVLAPVDGWVVHRRECYDPLLQREAIRITLRLHWFGAYCLRAPLEGEVKALVRSDKRCCASRIQTDEFEDVILHVVRGGLLGARPVQVPIGERVGQGRRCGLRRFAREIELLIPSHARVEVELGQRVRCGQTLLATLLRQPDARHRST